MPVDFAGTSGRGKLVTETDEAKRQVLARLLAEEEAKLAALTNPPHRKRG